MRQNLAIFYGKRMSARIRRISDAVKLIFDFWTALYIIVPLFIILFYTYQQWLTALPAWFRPEYELLLVLLLAVVAVKGNLRMYIVPADLVYLFRGPKSLSGWLVWDCSAVSWLTVPGSSWPCWQFSPYICTCRGYLSTCGCTSGYG